MSQMKYCNQTSIDLCNTEFSTFQGHLIFQSNWLRRNLWTFQTTQLTSHYCTLCTWPNEAWLLIHLASLTLVSLCVGNTCTYTRGKYIYTRGHLTKWSTMEYGECTAPSNRPKQNGGNLPLHCPSQWWIPRSGCQSPFLPESRWDSTVCHEEGRDSSRGYNPAATCSVSPSYVSCPIPDALYSGNEHTGIQFNSFYSFPFSIKTIQRHIQW